MFSLLRRRLKTWTRGSPSLFKPCLPNLRVRACVVGAACVRIAALSVYLPNLRLTGAGVARSSQREASTKV